MLTSDTIKEVSLCVKRRLPATQLSTHFSDLSIPAHVARVAQRVLATEDQEVVLVFILDGANRLIAFTEATRGTVNMSLVTAREVFRAAIVQGASAVVVCHNHPSGHVGPSAEDVAATCAMRDAGDILGIPLVDHVIVAADSVEYYSFREMGAL
jgi:DNA repair protein RadC